MKKKFTSIAVMIIMIFITSYLLKITINKNIELKNYKSKQILPKSKIKSDNLKKEANSYSTVINMVNKYNGEIKEFKTKNNNDKLINADILVTGNEKILSDFLGELRQYKDLNSLSSITFDNSSGDIEKYSLEVNAEFKTGK
ncbi:hypothetical protein [Clostridium akagii]|uniref:hypothetical protein n=1 Tax=Clostridium akagii TaxID=91623 RepID=UPI00047E378E|nr:hypothetical protein [Clostridium akagii]